MRRPDKRPQRRAAPRQHPRRRQRQLAVRRRQHRAKVRRNPRQRAPRQRQNEQRILHLPWRLRMQVRRKGIVQLSSATNSTSETLAVTPKAVKSAYDNAEKRLQKDQNGADIPDKDRFLSNINVYSKGEVDQKKGDAIRCGKCPGGCPEGKYYPLVIKGMIAIGHPALSFQRQVAQLITE